MSMSRMRCPRRGNPGDAFEGMIPPQHRRRTVPTFGGLLFRGVALRVCSKRRWPTPSKVNCNWDKPEGRKIGVPSSR